MLSPSSKRGKKKKKKRRRKEEEERRFWRGLKVHLRNNNNKTRRAKTKTDARRTEDRESKREINNVCPLLKRRWFEKATDFNFIE